MFDAAVVVASLLEHYNLGIPADKILYTLTYPQMYFLMDEISKKNEKTTKESHSEPTPQGSDNVAIVKNFADMWR